MTIAFKSRLLEICKSGSKLSNRGSMLIVLNYACEAKILTQ